MQLVHSPFSLNKLALDFSNLARDVFVLEEGRFRCNNFFCEIRLEFLGQPVGLSFVSSFCLLVIC